MPNDYYNVTGAPSQGSAGSSATMRAEFAAMAAGFDKLPALAGNALELVRVNTGATGLESVPASTVLADYLPVAGGTMTGPILVAAGSAAAPGAAFAGDSNNGWYSSAADTQDWAVAGARRMTLDGTSLTLRGGGSQALRIHDDGGYLAIWNSAGSTRTGYFQASTTSGLAVVTELNLPLLFATNSVERMRITGSGDFGFNCAPVSSILARFEDDSFDDAGMEFARVSANHMIIQSYNRTGTVYGTLSLDGTSVVVNSSGSQRYSFGANSISPAATNTYNLGGAGADWQIVYTRNVYRDTAGDLTIAATDAAGRIDLRVAGASALLLDSSGKAIFGGGAYTTTDSQSFTATPTFSANASNVHELGTMTANVTSCTITGASNGQTIQIRVKQDGTGGRTFAAPSGAKIVGSVGATANAASILTLTYSANDARWEGSWLNLPV